MVEAVRPGGHLLIANCVYPMIQCHIPPTFHLRYNLDRFCVELGLESLGGCDGSHTTRYRYSQIKIPNWPRLRTLEWRSKSLIPWWQLRQHHLSPGQHRMSVSILDPHDYPRKAAKRLALFL